MCSIAHATLVYILDVNQKRVFENMYLTSIGDHLWMDDNVPKYAVIYHQHQMSQEDNVGVMKNDNPYIIVKGK
jgi:hypothetical protein